MLLLGQIYILFSAISIDLWLTSLAWVILLLCFNKIRLSFKKSILLFALLLPVAGTEWNYRVDNLNNKAKTQTYTVLNKAGVYNLNLLMGTAGYVSGYKEVAIETILLGVPKDENVYLNSDFGMESEKVRSKIIDHIKSNRKSSTYNLAWTKKQHMTDSSRVALAINSFGKLNVKTVQVNGKTTYKCTLSADITYPESSRTKITLGHESLYLIMEESIFTGLQDAGIFKTYYAHWSWTINDIADMYNYKDFFWVDDLIEKAFKFI